MKTNVRALVRKSVWVGVGLAVLGEWERVDWGEQCRIFVGNKTRSVIRPDANLS